MPAATMHPSLPPPDEQSALELEGIYALEFADEYPDAPAECGSAQLGIITGVTANSITFDEANWLTRDELPADYAGDYDVQRTGESVTLTIDDNSQFWILWDSYAYRPARIEFVDSMKYTSKTPWELVCWFYSKGGVFIR